MDQSEKNVTTAERSLRFFPGAVIVKANHFEIVEVNK